MTIVTWPRPWRVISALWLFVYANARAPYHNKYILSWIFWFYLFYSEQKNNTNDRKRVSRVYFCILLYVANVLSGTKHKFALWRQMMRANFACVNLFIIIGVGQRVFVSTKWMIYSIHRSNKTSTIIIICSEQYLTYWHFIVIRSVVVGRWVVVGRCVVRQKINGRLFTLQPFVFVQNNKTTSIRLLLLLDVLRQSMQNAWRHSIVNSADSSEDRTYNETQLS